ncbi:MAG: lactate utilization protein B [Phaeodactylibacter xiamenensis]|uniref:4Fe-4S ferredoxin n=1 Tax=Phaeodactylibacter xiamenensis TaxID=1524460 RepID=A0A098S5D1_9BACT|nr:lactate utilization protein B [Phaeodactylibacter xiamenensis]KGE87023.1 4Fe-4S ferredoxin [Phaeodactylibacter xiamenensis]MCR9050709.1 lactate utilization protein [bacterium]
MKEHATKAAAFIQDEARTNWHDESLWFVRSKRDKAAHGIPEWEQLRELASQIKDHTLSHLDEYLEAFEAKAKENGVTVHWAADAAEHNRIVHSILQEHNARRIVKSKSMLTEECGLNEYLEEQDMEVIDTDLGERIIQLKEEPPSHIVMPAIHLKKEEVGELFHQKLQTKKGATDPQYLTEAARQHLRQSFLQADAAITGVNFAIAETGGVVVCTNEGNADMGTHLAPLQIHCMGIEKILPKAEHLGVFTRLLARSATGQPSTIFTSHHHKAKEGGAMHIVIVDNGRTTQLGRPDFRNSLKCIRCGACMNTCPIYRRSGGHSYDSTVPGPIGSILTPGIDLKKYSGLPFASTLCGSCSDVCPVKIDIHEQLYKWRQIIAEEGHLPTAKKQSMVMAGKVLSRPGWYKMAGKSARWVTRWLPRPLIYNPLNTWGKARELPEAPKESFQEWYRKNRSAS